MASTELSLSPAQRGSTPPAAGGGGPRRGGLLGAAERLTGFTVTGLAVGVVVIGGWLVAYFLGGRALYLIVYAGALTLVIAAVIAQQRRPVSARRSELPKRTREGQVTEVELELSTKRRVTAFVVEEKLHELLGDAVRVPVGVLSAGSEFTHRYTIRPLLRGVYKIGPLYAEWTDPFGLARRQQLLAEADEILVHPTVEQVFDRPLTRMWEDPPIRPPVTKPWPQGFEFYGMREYVRGDDPRRIIWKAVARTRKLLVKESEQGITDRVAVIIDNEAKRHSPGSPSDTFELAIRVAASVGARHIKDGFSVTLDCNDGALAKNLRGPRARINFLDELAKLQLSKEPLAKAVEQRFRDPRKDVHLVVVTPHLDAKTAASLQLLVQRGISVLMAMLVWEESDPNSIHRAEEIGAQVVQVKTGASLAGVFAHSLGAGIR